MYLTNGISHHVDGNAKQWQPAADLFQHHLICVCQMVVGQARWVAVRWIDSQSQHDERHTHYQRGGAEQRPATEMLHCRQEQQAAAKFDEA